MTNFSGRIAGYERMRSGIVGSLVCIRRMFLEGIGAEISLSGRVFSTCLTNRWLGVRCSRWSKWLVGPCERCQEAGTGTARHSRSWRCEPLLPPDVSKKAISTAADGGF